MAKECRAVKAYRESQERAVRNYRLAQDKAYARYAASCELALLWYLEKVAAEKKKGECVISKSILNGLSRYVNDHVPTGSFLRSVLENDLFEACSSADDDNRLVLFEICYYIWENLPAASYGSSAKVKVWLHED